MLPAKFLPLLRTICNSKCVHTSAFCLEKFQNPLWRTINVLRNDLRLFKDPGAILRSDLVQPFPTYVDILVIGGGAIGSSIAYWLKEKSGLNGIKLAVLEKDPTYAKSSTVLSVGGLRQQFSLPENILMSLFGAEFIRTLKDRFGSDADVYFTPNGYLTLASDVGAAQLLDNAKLQKELGAVNVLLSANELKERFPWLNVDNIEVGCLGLEKEGWFDPWAMLCLLKRGAIRAGAQYVTGELQDFTFSFQHEIEIDNVPSGTYQGIDEAIVKLPNGDMKSIKFAMCILACGSDSGEVAKIAKIGTGEGLLSIPLPIERRKRYVYCFNCQDEGPGLNTPMTIDYTGTYFRRDGLGGTFIAGLSPFPEEEPQTDNLDVDHQYFNEKIWPVLAHRVHAFNSIKVKSAWSGFYDYNYYDENGIIGPHPYYHNMFIAAGFSGHGKFKSFFA
ncbi:FAD dependent oxidoreductase [Oryctes borbonicus]|uniref:FAD dependent oxidoreductase n=1 Tax=Oryctes borbonicus TaxID=1629725 RepID=A0A0T6AUJ7_9SCAR|nr:FAD dependent oxidoreductase [Oryctes borbonicus]